MISRHLLLLLPWLGCSFLACGASSRPASLSDWDACLVRSAEIGGEERDRIDANRPGHSVLYVHATWGESAFRSEYQFAFLQVELEGEPRPATVQVTEATPALYREGSQAVGYESRRLVGQIAITAVDGDAATAMVSLRATPSVDLATRGPHEIRGEVRARFVSTSAECH